MKARRALLAAVLLGAGLYFFAPTSPSQAADATSCDLVGFVVKDPTRLSDTGSSAQFGAGDFGSATAGSVSLPSGVVCRGTINGAATVSGSFVWCPQDGHEHNAPGSSFDCNQPAINNDNATVQPDEALWPSDNPTTVHFVGSGTLHSNTNAPLTNAVTGTPYGSCNFSFQGHALAPVKIDITVTCGSSVMHGVSTAGFVPMIGASGDLFTSNNPHGACATYQSPPMPGGWPDCFRAVMFSGNVTVSTAT